MKKSVIILILLSLILSCSEDEDITISLSDFQVTIDENPSPNQVIGIIDATTKQGNLTFSITEQSPNNAFQINASTGELIVLAESLFDFETYPIITGTVTAENRNVSETANVIINLNNVDDTSITATDLYITVDENPNPNQVLGTIDASTNQGNLTFSITLESPENALQVNPNTGVLTVLTESLFDYETYPLITASVEADSGFETENINITIDLNDLDDTGITISNFEVTIDENPNPNQVLGTIDASTNQGNLTFSISGQSPNNAFQINTSTGELTVLNENSFDFETYPIITGTVTVENGFESENVNITVNLNNLTENFIEITNIVDTNIEGLDNVPSHNTLPDINSENFQNSPLIITKSYETTHQGDIACFASRGLLNFDLTSIPSNINITNVQLVLHKDNVIYCPPCGPNDNQNTQLYFQLINSTWDVATVNWENQPSTDTNQSTSLHILDIENVNNFNITNLFLELYNNQNIYEGLMLKMTESCIQESVSFFSSNYSDTSKRPKIIIQYN
jgi:predicted secreted protein